MQGLIYKATNKINQKIYIGQTIQPLSARISAHKKSKHALGRAIRKYGLENINFTVVDRAEDRESLNAKEVFWIEFFKSFSREGYNLTSGGDAPAEFAPETCAKISAAKIGGKHSPETCAKMSAAAQNRTPETRANMAAAKRNISDETRAKMAAAKLGKKQPAEMVAKRNAANTGKTRTPEFCALKSEHAKNRTPEHRNKLAAAIKGKTPSPEARAKMSESAKRRHSRHSKPQA